MAKEKLIDPVSEDTEKVSADSLDIGKLKFQAVPQSAAKIVRPFDGYPLNKKVKFGEGEICPTFIVALNPTVMVQQDPNNKKVKTPEGMKQIQTFHSRFIRDRETGDNIEVVFDRKMIINGQTFLCAVVPSHVVRSQIVFKFNNKTNRPEVDTNYMLLDLDQVSRLRQVFLQVINPNLKIEKEAAFISGESTVDAGEQEPLTEEQV